MTIKIHTFNVSHGDSLIIEINTTKRNYHLVIDCHNPNRNADSPTLNFLKQNRITHLDLVCLTHPDIDHYSGMYQLLEYYSRDSRTIGDFILPILDHKYLTHLTSKRKEVEIKKLYSLVGDLQSKQKLTIRTAGFNTIILEENEIKIISLSPLGIHFEQYAKQVRKRNLEILENKKPSSINSNLISIVLLIQFDTSNSLLCSDATASMIEGSLKKWVGNAKKEREQIRFNFIKISHHGSKHNHSVHLLKDYTIPTSSNAALSCGAEWPHQEVIDDLKKYKINTYATNKTGCLRDNLLIKAKDENIPFTVKEGLDNLSMQDLVDQHLHGDISFIDDTTQQIIKTQFNILPIR
ncbi:MAG: hypothetical protein ABI550_03935 [Ignavibacteriaceae bacterium]